VRFKPACDVLASGGECDGLASADALRVRTLPLAQEEGKRADGCGVSTRPSRTNWNLWLLALGDNHRHRGLGPAHQPDQAQEHEAHEADEQDDGNADTGASVSGFRAQLMKLLGALALLAGLVAGADAAADGPGKGQRAPASLR
jgi:hypothetical protein